MNLNFQYGYATGTEPNELTNVCLRNIHLPPSEHTLGFLYATDALATQLPEIIQQLQDKTGIRHWIGTLGTAIACTQLELYDRPALVIMVGEFPINSFRVLPLTTTKNTLALDNLQPWIADQQACVGIIHGDPTQPDTPILIENLSDTLGGGFFTGGLTSSQNEPLQIADTISSGGISGALFSSHIEIITGHSQGCSTMGGYHTITRSQGNLISTLDNRPALDILKEAAGEVLSRDLNKMGGYIFVGLPVQASDTGDYMVRNLIGIDPERKMIAIGDIARESSAIVFCRRDGNTAREDMLKMLNSLKKRSEGKVIAGGVYHSCLGRGRHQFGDDSAELKLISHVLGDFPLVGFFANGEIFHNRIYAYTGVLTLFLSQP